MSGWSFAWRVGLEGVALSGGTGWLIWESMAVLPIHVSRRTDIDNFGPLGIVMLILICGPFCETLLFQTLLVAVAKAFKLPKLGQLLVSVGGFATAHFMLSIPTGITAGLICGSYLAFTYIKFCECSILSAILSTWGMHAAFNLLTLLSTILSRYAGTVGTPH